MDPATDYDFTSTAGSSSSSVAAVPAPAPAAASASTLASGNQMQDPAIAVPTPFQPQFEMPQSQGQQDFGGDWFPHVFQQRGQTYGNHVAEGSNAFWQRLQRGVKFPGNVQQQRVQHMHMPKTMSASVASASGFQGQAMPGNAATAAMKSGGGYDAGQGQHLFLPPGAQSNSGQSWPAQVCHGPPVHPHLARHRRRYEDVSQSAAPGVPMGAGQGQEGPWMDFQRQQYQYHFSENGAQHAPPGVPFLSETSQTDLQSCGQQLHGIGAQFVPTDDRRVLGYQEAQRPGEEMAPQDYDMSWDNREPQSGAVNPQSWDQMLAQASDAPLDHQLPTPQNGGEAVQHGQLLYLSGPASDNGPEPVADDQPVQNALLLPPNGVPAAAATTAPQPPAAPQQPRAGALARRFSCHRCLHKCKSQADETTSNKDLERHAVIHSPEPKFSCQFCGQPGKRKDNMRRHERTCKKRQGRDMK